MPFCSAWGVGLLCSVRGNGCDSYQQCTSSTPTFPNTRVRISGSRPTERHVDSADSLHNASFLRQTPFIFSVPGTLIKLHLSSFHGLLNQGELDLCIIEGLSKIFETVVATGSDGGLPLHYWTTRWVNIIFTVEDVHPPAFAMTYGYLVSTLRGVALFASQYGYVEMDIEVYHDTKGYVGIGNLGQIIPSTAS